jgi:hypothetical protein
LILIEQDKHFGFIRDHFDLKLHQTVQKDIPVKVKPPGKTTPEAKEDNEKGDKPKGMKRLRSILDTWASDSDI